MTIKPLEIKINIINKIFRNTEKMTALVCISMISIMVVQGEEKKETMKKQKVLGCLFARLLLIIEKNN